jgi:hypoxanthine phosphoribosyltransferase
MEMQARQASESAHMTKPPPRASIDTRSPRSQTPLCADIGMRYARPTMPEKLCFVVMPFGRGPEYPGEERESTFVFERIIKPAVVDATAQFRKTHGDTSDNTLEVRREAETVNSGDITHSIIRHLAEAHVTIVDLTGRNPNVFFELGVRFALKRNGTILLTQDRTQIPFNVQQFRVVEYDPKYDGIDTAIAKLSDAVKSTLETLAERASSNTDSLIFQALPQLKVAGPGLTEEAPSQSTNITWEEYWDRTTHIENELGQLRATGAYSPDVILGISNGGLFLADTCLRLVYGNNIPIICLWAQRSKEKYFSNPINDAVIDNKVFDQLRMTLDSPEDRPLKLLVMDDIVGTQRTFTQLVDYFQERLGSERVANEIELRFVFLFTPREENLSKLQGYRLSADTEIAKKYRRMDLESITDRSQLPYRKNIHYGDIVDRSKSSTGDKFRADEPEASATVTTESA